MRARAGFALPFMVLLVVVFIGIAAITIDISRMFVIRNQLQTAADAGAIAGAMQLSAATNRESGYDSARVFAQRNLVEKVQPDVSAGDIVPGAYDQTTSTFTATGSWTDVRTNADSVKTQHTGAYVLGPIYSIFTKGMSASGIAAIGSVVETKCVRPLAFSYQRLRAVLYPGAAYNPADTLTTADVLALKAATILNEIAIKRGSGTDADNPGNFYSVVEPPAFDSTLGTFSDQNYHEKDYEDFLALACPDVTPIYVGEGDWLRGYTGNRPNAIDNALGAKCTVPDTVSDGTHVMRCATPIEWLIPIWDVYADKLDGAGGGTFYHIKYVGVFMATAYEPHGGGNVWGYFSALNATGPITVHPGPAYTVQLMR